MELRKIGEGKPINGITALDVDGLLKTHPSSHVLNVHRKELLALFA